MAHRTLVALLAAALVAGPGVPAAADTTVVALVASSTARSLGEIATVYEKSHPGVHVQISGAGSKVVADEVAQGAAADLVVLSSAVAKSMTGTEPPQDVYISRSVVIVNPKARGKIKSPKDLASPGVKLADGTEGSVAAQVTDETLKSLTKGFGAEFGAKARANILVRRTSLEAIAKLVEDGTVDAAIVYASDAVPGVAVYDLGSEAFVQTYAAAVVKNAPNAAAARDLIALLHSAAGQQILRAHHQEPVFTRT